MKHRMINCTTEALINLLNKSEWRRIVKNIANIRIPTDSPINIDEYVCDQSDSEYEVISMDENIVIHENDSFLKDIQNNPREILKYPKDIFIVDEGTKSKIPNNTGVIIMTDDRIDTTPLKLKWTGKLTHNNKFYWKSFFKKNGRDMSSVPNNALIITDLYLFDYHWKQGLQNISAILEEILPESFDSEYHVLIVTTENKDNYNKPFVAKDKAVEELRDITSKLGCSYDLVIEVLFIDNNKCRSEEEEKARFELLKASHNRRVYSNSFIIYADHGYNAVVGMKDETRLARWDQKIEFQCLYHDVDNKYDGLYEQPINFIDDYLQYLSRIVEKSLNVGEYFINGKKGRIQDMVNRLIRY